MSAFRKSVRIGCVLLPWWVASSSAQVLQDGDIVIGANGVDGWGSLYGRVHRLRGQELTVLFESGHSGIPFGSPYDVLIDAQGRIVFTSYGCDGNGNNSRILRYDPATNALSQLLCIPYSVGPGGPPPGFPPEATGFYGIQGLHLTRSLRIVIDDDVNDGVPQTSYAESYGFSVAVYPRPTFLYGQWWDLYHAEAFRWIVDEQRVEPGISTALIPNGGNQGAKMVAGGGYTYYTAMGKIGRAAPDLSLNLSLHATVGGSQITVQGSLRVAARNEILFDGDLLDNTLQPNGSATCTINGQQVTDNNVPWDGSGHWRSLSPANIGLLNGSLFAVSRCVCTGWPYMFGLARRDPFLNPYVCDFTPCVSHAGPYNFWEDPPALFNTTVDDGRILGGDDNGGRVFAINANSYQLLASGLTRPRGAAAFPGEAPPMSAGVLVIRVDSPVNVLLTDPAGRRIGYAADGSVVNDFQDEGAVLALGPEGHPRVYAVANPLDGTYGVQATGTGDGEYTLRGYLAETSTGGVVHPHGGQARTGVTEEFALHVRTPLAFAWLRPGDMNCDGAVDAQDTPAFVTALLDPEGYAGQFPTCELFNADVNRDSRVDGDDVQPFVSMLIHG